jgi:putative NADH-flavin reductase
MPRFFAGALLDARVSTIQSLKGNNMEIAIVGATGNVGTRIVDEALRRGHHVTAISRNPGSTNNRARLRLIPGDAHQPATLARLLVGHDAVVSSVMFLQSDPAQLVAAVRTSAVRRYLVVGGAGSLEVAAGQLNIDQPDFPAFAKAEATRGKEFLDYLHGVQDLDWTFLSPSSLFTAGERTGVFRLGKDALLTGKEGTSWISYEDYAVALLDEIEQPQHIRERFTVGY